MDLLKAVPLGGLLTAIISLFAGSGGTKAGQLNVQLLQLSSDISFYWSWPLFAIGTALAWGIFALQR